MTTPAAKEETLEQIAERLLALTIGKVEPAVYRELVADTAAALRNERETRWKPIETCPDNTIKAMIILELIGSFVFVCYMAWAIGR